jgi:hypothetical protein
MYAFQSVHEAFTLLYDRFLRPVLQEYVLFEWMAGPDGLLRDFRVIRKKEFIFLLIRQNSYQQNSPKKAMFLPGGCI